MNLNQEINFKALFGMLSRVRMADLVTFTRELSTLNNAGLSLVRSLTSLRDQMPQGKFRQVLTNVVEGVERGDSFSESLSHHHSVFSKMYVNMVHAGEVSGTLDDILKRLAALLEKQQRLRKRLRAALIYPAFVLSTAFIILCVLMIFVVPTFTKMFADLGGELPLPTRILIAISTLFTRRWYVLVTSVVGTIVLVKYLLTFPRVKYAVDRMLLVLPIVGKLLSRVTIAQITRTLGTLLSSGVPILTALHIVRDTTTNLVYAEAVPSLISSVKEGENLAQLLEHTKLFPNLVVKMVGVGEETGQLSDMLVKVADTYEEDIDVLVSSLSSLMEPLLIVVMGLIVGFIVVAMFLPLFNITELI